MHCVDDHERLTRACTQCAGIVAAKLGGQVSATDLEPNLPLLRKNAAANGETNPLL